MPLSVRLYSLDKKSDLDEEADAFFPSSSKTYLTSQNDFQTLDQKNRYGLNYAESGTERIPATDIKISTGENSEGIYSEIKVPDLDKKTAFIQYKEGFLELTYLKKNQSDFTLISKTGKKTKKVFFKKIIPPQSANPVSYRTRFNEDRIKIIFRKKRISNSPVQKKLSQ